MQGTIPDLWPPEAAATFVVSPVAIMRHQAGQLRAKTHNLLEADVRSGQSKDGEFVVHEFQLVAPALGRYRYTVFSASHNKDLVYPVKVTTPKPSVMLSELEARVANSQDEFLAIVKDVLNSGHTKSVIHSLLARINDQSPPPPPDSP